MWPFQPRRADEDGSREPLLASDAERQHDLPPTTPLPWGQLTILGLMRLTEPIAFTVIFPFINQMLEEIGVTPDHKRIGYYAGIIESLFAISQLCTVFLWGRLSDRIGRKPVLITGLSGLMVGVTAFGLQRHFVGLVISRAFAGFMNGNIAILKSVLAEITDETNQARAFALPPLCFAIGLTIGPALGGFLSKPAEQFPSVFGGVQFWIDFPFFLPCAVAGLLNLVAVGLGVLFLKETLPLENRRKPGKASNATVEAPPPVLSILTNRQIVTCMFSFFLFAMFNSAWSALVPLFAYTRVPDGGLGLSLNQIGTALSSNGFVSIFFQIIVMPPLQRRVGTVPLYRLVLPFNVLAFLALPILSTLGRDAGVGDGGKVGGLVVALALKSIGGMGMVCITLLIANSAPSRASLGAVNGLAQMCSSFARGIAPIGATSLFAFSISHQSVLGGQLVWVVAVLVASLSWLTAFVVKGAKAPWREQPTLETVKPASRPPSPTAEDAEGEPRRHDSSH